MNIFWWIFIEDEHHMNIFWWFSSLGVHKRCSSLVHLSTTGDEHIPLRSTKDVHLMFIFLHPAMNIHPCKHEHPMNILACIVFQRWTSDEHLLMIVLEQEMFMWCSCFYAPGWTSAWRKLNIPWTSFDKLPNEKMNIRWSSFDELLFVGSTKDVHVMFMFWHPGTNICQANDEHPMNIFCCIAGQKDEHQMNIFWRSH